jgi:hypothetical protein
MVDMNLLNLTLGIVGTIAGMVSLSVHIWRLRLEKPRLSMNILSCNHYFEESSRILSFWSQIEIRNLGDRGTNLLGMVLNFEHDKKNLTVKLAHQDCENENGSLKWIRPHETIRIQQTGFTKIDKKPTKQIESTFIIYHTHGEQKTDGKSQMSSSH